MFQNWFLCIIANIRMSSKPIQHYQIETIKSIHANKNCYTVYVLVHRRKKKGERKSGSKDICHTKMRPLHHRCAGQPTRLRRSLQDHHAPPARRDDMFWAAACPTCGSRSEWCRRRCYASCPAPWARSGPPRTHGWFRCAGHWSGS